MKKTTKILIIGFMLLIVAIGLTASETERINIGSIREIGDAYYINVNGKGLVIQKDNINSKEDLIDAIRWKTKTDAERLQEVKEIENIFIDVIG